MFDASVHNLLMQGDVCKITFVIFVIIIAPVLKVSGLGFFYLNLYCH
jgi:hypothetical protein